MRLVSTCFLFSFYCCLIIGGLFWSHPSVANSLTSEGCPKNTQEWGLRLRIFSKELTPELGNDKNYQSGVKLLPVERYKNVLEFWERCSQVANTETRKNFSNILRHSRFMVKAQSAGHSGFAIADHEYALNSLAENSAFGFLPKSFFKDEYLPVDWQDFLSECTSHSVPISENCLVVEDWQFIDFYSTLEDGSGHHRRLIVKIPRDGFQQYVLFFPELPNHENKKLVNIISLQTHDVLTGEKLERNRLHFFEKNQKGFVQDGGRCFTCHGNGLREIRPMLGTVTDWPEFQKIQSFNQEVRSFAPIDWQGLIDFDALGPPMGESCVLCHSRQGSRAPITIFSKPSMLRSKVQELEMPFSFLYQAHFNAVEKLIKEGDVALKNKIKQQVLSRPAHPHRDYRLFSEVRRSREFFYEQVLASGFIHPIWSYLMGLVEKVGSWHIESKLEGFFDDHEARFRRWLQGE